MPTVEIRIPQLGEGLQEARIVRFLKQPGDAVAQDEPLFEMETDKAAMEIESPAAGVVASWQAHEDDVLPIGAVVGILETGPPSPPVTGGTIGRPGVDLSAKQTGGPPNPPITGGTIGNSGVDRSDRSVGSDSATVSTRSPRYRGAGGAADLRTANVPPRTRAYARQKGLSDEQLAALVQSRSGRILPEDVDRWMAEGERTAESPGAGTARLPSALEPPAGLAAQPASAGFAESGSPANPRPGISAANSVPTPNAQRPTPESSPTPYPLPPTPSLPGPNAYEDVALPQRQRTLVYRLQQGMRDVIPATMEMHVRWEQVEAARAQLKTSPVGPPASQFLIFAWCVAQAARAHQRFRSTVLGDGTLRQYEHVNLGIAVSRGDDELVMARVDSADSLEFPAFLAAAHEAIQQARDGRDQASEAMQVSLSHMPGSGVTLGIPVVTAPSVGTLFLGDPYDEAFPLPGGGVGFRRVAAIVLTFDHRAANGIGAASFLAEIKQRVESVGETLTPHP